jgi:hypothetical protein
MPTNPRITLARIGLGLALVAAFVLARWLGWIGG